MNTTKLTKHGRKWIALTVMILGSANAFGGTFSADFNDGAVPAGSAVYGATLVATNGGVDDTGVLKITQAVNVQTGSFVIEDLDPGASQGMNSFAAAFKLRVGGGTPTPADGFSFSVGNDLPAAAWDEEGPATGGLTVACDIYDNGGGEAPAIDLKWNGVELRHTVVPISFLRTGAGFVDVLIKRDADGTFDLNYSARSVYSNVLVPGFLQRPTRSTQSRPCACSWIMYRHPPQFPDA